MPEVWAYIFTRVVREGFLEEMAFGQRPKNEKELALGRPGQEGGRERGMEPS